MSEAGTGFEVGLGGVLIDPLPAMPPAPGDTAAAAAFGVDAPTVPASGAARGSDATGEGTTLK